FLSARPRRGNGEILKDETAVVDVFFNRRERDRPAAFFQSLLFASQASVDHGEDAKRRPVIRLCLHGFFLRASRFKSSVRACLVFGHPRQQPLPKAAAQTDRAFAPTGIVAQRDEGAFGRSRIAFSQRALEPDVRGASNGARSLPED